MKIDWPAKEAGDTVDYSFDLAGLLQENEGVADVDVVGEGVTVDDSGADSGILTVWLSGGVEGTVGRVSATITTDSVPARTYVLLAVVPIGTSPIGLGAMKAYLRVDFDTEDTLIAGLLRAAVNSVEIQSGHVLAPRVIERRLDRFPDRAISAPVEPVSEVVSVTYLNSDGTTVTLAEADYRSIDGEPFLVVPAIGTSWPSALDERGSVRVRMLAGYEAGLAPAPLLQAVKMLVAHWYENREAVSGQNLDEVPLGVQSLIWPYRRVLVG